MNVYICCPVRIATPETRKELEEYAAGLEAAGNKVHLPHRDTDQSATSRKICEQNAAAIAAADEIHVFFDPASAGSHFDLGVAWALGKKIVVARNVECGPGKSFALLVDGWGENGPPKPLAVPIEKAKEPEPVLQKDHNVGGHYYPGCATKDFYTSDCEYGCGCWMGQSRSGGPDGVDPFGPCPGNSAHEPASPVGEMVCTTCKRQLKLCRCTRYVCGPCLKLLGADNGHDRTFPAGDHLDSLVKCFRCGGSARPLYWMTAYHYAANVIGSLKPFFTHHGPDFQPQDPDVKELRSRIEKASGTLLEMLGRDGGPGWFKAKQMVESDILLALEHLRVDHGYSRTNLPTLVGPPVDVDGEPMAWQPVPTADKELRYLLRYDEGSFHPGCPYFTIPLGVNPSEADTEEITPADPRWYGHDGYRLDHFEYEDGDWSENWLRRSVSGLGKTQYAVTAIYRKMETK